jgi:hypothetical protein
MVKKHYRLAVEGEKNSTVVGRSYNTIREALNDVNRVNEQRTEEGLKPVTVLKVSTNQGTYKHFQYVDHYDDDDE